MFQITELQLDVLRALWDRGRASVAEVTASLQSARDLAPTTVATLLARLERRGLVSREMEGRRHVYSPRVSEDQVRSAALDTLTDGVFGGDVSAVVSQLLAQREISPGDLARVKEILDALEPDVESPDGG